jgi:hypothetical protein
LNPEPREQYVVFNRDGNVIQDKFTNEDEAVEFAKDLWRKGSTSKKAPHPHGFVGQVCEGTVGNPGKVIWSAGAGDLREKNGRPDLTFTPKASREEKGGKGGMPQNDMRTGTTGTVTGVPAGGVVASPRLHEIIRKSKQEVIDKGGHWRDVTPHNIALTHFEDRDLTDEEVAEYEEEQRTKRASLVNTSNYHEDKNRNFVITGQPDEDETEDDYVDRVFNRTGFHYTPDLSYVNIGMTNAPGLTDRTDDDGNWDGDIWWFPNYMVEDWFETLKEKGQAVFTYAPSDEKEEDMSKNASRFPKEIEPHIITDPAEMEQTCEVLEDSMKDMQSVIDNFRESKDWKAFVREADRVSTNIKHVTDYLDYEDVQASVKANLAGETGMGHEAEIAAEVGYKILGDNYDPQLTDTKFGKMIEGDLEEVIDNVLTDVEQGKAHFNFLVHGFIDAVSGLDADSDAVAEYVDGGQIHRSGLDMAYNAGYAFGLTVLDNDGVTPLVGRR